MKSADTIPAPDQRRHIVCDMELCAGCQLCEFACAAGKTGAFDLELSRIRLARPEATLMASIACQLCSDAPCQAVCPREALSTNPDSGAIVVDKVKCIGCGWCVEACDHGAIALDPRTRMAVVCDLCIDLSEPRCVTFCPKGALRLDSVNATPLLAGEHEH